MIQLLLLATAATAVGAFVGTPCDVTDCATGLVCRMALPQSCHMTPCPRSAVCIPSNHSCDNHKCGKGETCELREVTCVKAPCNPVPECVKYPKCAENEEYNECSRIGKCEPTCDNKVAAEAICADVSCGKGACECKIGYVRHNGKCVDPETCPAKECPKGQIWTECSHQCPDTCRTLRGKDPAQLCTASCGRPACVCDKGRVLDDKGNCVLEDECPKEFICNRNEEFVECSKTTEPSCDNRNPTTITACGPAKCQCSAGFVRAQNSCINPLQCPQHASNSSSPHGPLIMPFPEQTSNHSSNSTGGPLIMPFPEQICGENEQYDSCFNGCASTCQNQNAMCNKKCGPGGCACKQGFLRDETTDKCVLKDQCSNSTSALTCETVECAAGKICKIVNGEPTCTPRGPLILPSPELIDPTPNSTLTCATVKCAGGSMCEIVNGAPKCIPDVSSTPPPITCDNVDLKCSEEETCRMKEVCNKMNPPVCKLAPGCAKKIVTPSITCANVRIKCSEGETCVMKETCNKKNPPVCTSAPGCGKNAADTPSITCENVDLKCSEGETCVMKETCNKMNPPVCKAAPGCGKIVNGATCESIRMKCKEGESCVMKEVCGDKECVFSPTCGVPGGSCPKNESMVECSNKCNEPHCDDSRINKMCPMNCGPPACQCSEGYSRNAAGNCVLYKDCKVPVAHACAEGESMAQCGNKCVEKRCDDQQENPRACPDICMAPACLCSEGYARDTSGKCVPQGLCPENRRNQTSADCVEGEEWKDCGSACAEAKCPSSVHTNIVCPRVCMPRCECKKGLMRAPNGKCVDNMRCPAVQPVRPDPKTCSKNETWSECMNSCNENKCGVDLSAISCPAVCNQGCACQTGYARTAGRCVKEADCPPIPKSCQKNEHVDKCPNSCSEPACGDGDAMWCAGLMYCDPPACKCDDGFVRNGKGGACIKREKCAGEGNSTGLVCGDNEEVKECSSSCEPHCNSDLIKMVCPAVCGPPACQCSSGFLRDHSNGKCVKKEQCPKREDPSSECPANQTWSDCPSTCKVATCANPSGQQSSRVCLTVCGQAGCICKSGFVKDTDGACVKAEDCGKSRDPSSTTPAPSNNTCPLNEQYTECTSPCEENCKDRVNELRICPAVCGQPGCTCSKGFVRDSATKSCVPRSKCSPGSVGVDPSSCGKNEVYRECANGCMEPFCGDEKLARRCADICNPPACECKKGFVRNHNTSKCIRRKNCPKREISVITPENACVNHNCAEDEYCTPVAVACIRAPCPAIAQCLKIDPDNVCDNSACPEGEFCTPLEVQCIRAPCYPQRRCVKESKCMMMRCTPGTQCRDRIDGTSYCAPLNTQPARPGCMTMKCTAETTCVETPRGGRCVPDAPVDPILPTCETTSCIATHTCVEGPAGAECVPIDGMPGTATTQQNGLALLMPIGNLKYRIKL